MNPQRSAVRHPLYGRREEKAARLRELVGAGLTVPEAAREVGIARNTAYAYLNDPSGEKQKATVKRGTCVECGGPTSARKRRRCATCSRLGPRRYWTRERIVEAIRLWVVTYGDVPRTSDWSPRERFQERRAKYRRLRARPGPPPFPSTTTVYSVFGSLTAAIEAAGYRPRPPGGNPRPHPTHCKNNHPFDAANTYVYPDGHYGCRACRRKFQRKHRPPKGPRKRCKRGHRLTKANTIVNPKTGWRRCRKCSKDRKAARRRGLLVG